MPRTDANTSPTPNIVVLQSDPADSSDQAYTGELESVIEDYLWVRRDEVLTIGGHRFFI